MVHTPEFLEKVKEAGDGVDALEIEPAYAAIEDASIEERVYCAIQQRRTYGLHSSDEGAPKAKWFAWFDNDFGPAHEDNPLIARSKPLAQIEDDKQALRLDDLPTFEREKAEARRALRTASWAAMFYLITTDVIGPFNAPYAISQVGLVGGVWLYITFGVAAFYSSVLILNLFLRLDSDRHPIRTFGDLMSVFMGAYGQYTVAVIQVVQIIFITASNNIANANGMTQLTANRSSGPLCYIVSIVIWTVIGFVNSVPFRDLGKLSIVCSFNVFINVVLLALSMGFFAHSSPNYASAAAAYGYPGPPYAPIEVVATISGDLAAQVNGAMNVSLAIITSIAGLSPQQMVFGWSGLMVFVEFMNEMRRPYDFIKSFTAAEIFVFVIYITYGVYVYALQGQYTLPVAFQGVQPYTWQSAGNGLSLWTYTMASVLYMNIAIKVVYKWLVEVILKGPPINTKTGWIWWTGLQAVGWALSFVIGAAIPQVQTIQGLVAAACLLQFSYTFPPFMQLCYDISADASKADGVYVPGQAPARVDSWRDFSRWKRGLLSGRIYFKSFNLIYLLAALATCGLGIWGSVETIKTTFETSQATSFGCAAPV